MRKFGMSEASRACLYACHKERVIWRSQFVKRPYAINTITYHRVTVSVRALERLNLVHRQGNHVVPNEAGVDKLRKLGLIT